MSRYSDYEKKLAPWVNLKHFCHRHRVILIAASAAIACTAVALTSTKGIVTDQTIVLDHITYGQALTYGSSAFMGKANYEFSLANEDNWSSVAPSNVGSYKMRAKSDNSFGGSYYGGTHYFSIEPYATNCELSTLTYAYGSKPDLKIGLVGKDKVSSYDIAYDDISKDNPIASIENLKITNEAGGDVTANYSIAYSSSEVSLIKGSLILNFPTKTFTYDGNCHGISSNDYTLKGSLAAGDEIKFDLNSITNVGSTTAIVDSSVKVIHDGISDVSSHYNISVSYGTIKVNQASVNLTSVSLSKEYDGLPFDSLEYSSLSAKTGIIDGEDVEITYEDQSSNVAPGTYQNKFSFEFDPYSAAANYNVTSNYGSLLISKRKIGVTIKGRHTYSGSNFAGTIPSNEISITSGSLVNGHSLTCYVEDESSCLNNQPNVLYKIVDSNGMDVSSYYDFSLDSSALRYSKRELIVQAKGVSFTYDGAIHSGGYACSGLAEGDTVKYSSIVPSYSDLTSSNGKAIKISYSPKIEGIYSPTGENRTKYYNVSYGEGTFTLNPRPLTILLSVNRDYATMGTSISNPLNDAEYTFLDDTSLVDGHNFRIVPSDIYSKSPEFKVLITNSNGEDVKINYDIQLDSSSVTFSKSQILLTGLENNSVVYDGEYHGVTPIVSGLRDGDSLTFEEGFGPEEQVNKRIKAGTYSFEYRIASIKDASGEDVTNNYKFESSYIGGLEITKAPAVTAALTISKEYDGGDLVLVNGTDYVVSGLVSSDTASISLNEDPFLNPTTTNFDVNIVNSNLNENVNDCYEDITKLNQSDISWKPGELKVEAVSNSVVYDGNPTSIAIRVSGLALKDQVEYKYNETPIIASSNGEFFASVENCSVGSYPLNVSITGVKHISNLLDASAYYSSLTAVSGSLTIAPRPLNIKLYKHGSSPAYELTGGTTLADNQTLKFTYNVNGDRRVDYVPQVVDIDGNEVTSNYSITINGESTFDRIPLTVRYKDASIVYDGLSHSGVVEVSGIPSGCSVTQNTITLEDNPEESKALYAGDSVTFTPSVKSIVDAEGADETNLFYVTTIPGTLTIEKRPIHISISGSKVYNGKLFSETSLNEGRDYTITDTSADAGLVSGETLTITPIDDGTGSIIGAADGNDFKVSIKNGSEERTSNYDVTLEVDYTFSKAELSISTAGGSYEYDGQSHKGDAVVTAKGNDVANSINGTSSETEVGEYDYSITVTSVASSSGEDRSAYYNLPSDAEASFSIHQCGLTVTFPNYSTFKTGASLNLENAYSHFSSKIKVNNLPQGFSLDYTWSSGPTEPGTYDFKDYVAIKVLSASKEDKTSNFSIAVNGRFTINDSLNIKVAFANQSKTYDGSAFDLNAFAWTSSGYPKGCTLNYSETKKVPSAYSAGTHSLDTEILSSMFYLTDSNGGIVDPSSYCITILNQPLFTINKCKISFATKDIDSFYMGQPLSVGCGSASVKSSSSKIDSLGNNVFTCNNGDRITLIPSSKTFTFYGPTTESVSNGSEENPWTYTITRNGVDVSSNYEISFVYGSITIYDFSD